jgi:transcriptional regulator with XRE-family HTH domain
MKKRENASEVQWHAGRRLKAARIALGFSSQEEFAKRLGATRTQYAHWEQGTRLPGVHSMLRLFHHFGIPLEWIYAGSLRQVPLAISRALIQHATEAGAHIEGAVSHGPSDIPDRPAQAAMQ